MSTVHTIFENGVFRPLAPVELPESCEVEFEPRLVSAGQMNNVYNVLASVTPPAKPTSPNVTKSMLT